MQMIDLGFVSCGFDVLETRKTNENELWIKYVYMVAQNGFGILGYEFRTQATILESLNHLWVT